MISIIVPFYNAIEEYLLRCVSSIQAQTYKDWELIMVNDGSTNGCEDVIRYLSKTDDRILLYEKPNGGVSSARNYGLIRSKGDYIFFLDSDDWLSDDACEVLLNTMEKQGVDCVVCGFNQTHGNIWAPEFNKSYLSLRDLKRDFDYWLNTELLSSSVNKLYKRKLLTFAFPEHMSFGEDLVFSLCYLSQCDTVEFIVNPLYQHEVYNAGSLTHSFKIERFDDIEKMQCSIIDFADHITGNTNKKYCYDVISLVKALFRQRNMHNREKIELLKVWYSKSNFRTIDLRNCKLSLSDYVYARTIQLSLWRLLAALHSINNKIKNRV